MTNSKWLLVVLHGQRGFVRGAASFFLDSRLPAIVVDLLKAATLTSLLPHLRQYPVCSGFLWTHKKTCRRVHRDMLIAAANMAANTMLLNLLRGSALLLLPHKYFTPYKRRSDPERVTQHDLPLHHPAGKHGSPCFSKYHILNLNTKAAPI